MLKNVARNILFWTVLFFAALSIEEASLALWNGYSLTTAIPVSQIVAFPAVFVLGIIVTGILLPFFVKLAFPYRAISIILITAILAISFILPLSRNLLKLLLSAFLYSNWWHPIQNTSGLFWALLPFPTATVFLAYMITRLQGNSLWIRPLSVAIVIFLVLLALSGIDNSLCLGNWYGGLSSNKPNTVSSAYIIFLHLGENNHGRLTPVYKSFPNRVEPSLDKAYNSIYSGNMIWVQKGRTIKIYKEAGRLRDVVGSLVATGNVSSDADTISLYMSSPSNRILLYRDNKQ